MLRSRLSPVRGFERPNVIGWLCVRRKCDAAQPRGPKDSGWRTYESNINFQSAQSSRSSKIRPVLRSHLSNVINGKVRDVPHLPSVRIGQRVLFPRESLEQWLRQIAGDAREKITRPPEIKQ